MSICCCLVVLHFNIDLGTFSGLLQLFFPCFVQLPLLQCFVYLSLQTCFVQLSLPCLCFMMFCLVVFTVYVLLCDCGSLYYSRHEPPANTDAGEMPHPAGSILRSNCTSPKMEGGLGLPSSNDKNQKPKYTAYS